MLYGYGAQLLLGTWVTIKLTFVSLLIGSLLGMVLAAGQLSRFKAIALFCNGLTTVIRGLPELLVLFAIYFGGQILLVKLVGHYIDVDYFVAGTFALSLIFAAYFSETLRGAYLTISKGSIEAAQAYGFSSWQRCIHILLPKMWRYALPGFGNLCLVLLKDTSIVSLIGLSDLMGASYLASSATELPLLFYVLAAAIYLALTSCIMLLLRYLNRKLSLPT